MQGQIAVAAPPSEPSDFESWLARSASLRLAEPIVPQVIQLLRQAIIELRLRPGQALSEAEIARLLGISRQPVREAFIQLRELGLLHVLPSRGTYVFKISVREVLNARFVREAIECALARTAAEVMNEADFRVMRDNLARQEEAISRADHAAFYALDEQFHGMIARSVECDYASRVVESARAQIDRVRFLSLPDATPLPVLLKQHREIAGAIMAHDSDAAEIAMRAHLRQILSALPLLAHQHPDLFEASQVPRHAAAITPKA